MKQVEIEKDWRVSVASIAFILGLVVGLDYYHSLISGFLSGVPFYGIIFTAVAVFFLVGAWVLRKIY